MKMNYSYRVIIIALSAVVLFASANGASAQQSEDTRKSREAAAMADLNAADERRAMLRAAIAKEAKMMAAQKAEMAAEDMRKSRANAALAERNIAASRRSLLSSMVKRQTKMEAKQRATAKAKMMAQDAQKMRAAAAVADLKAADERRAMLRARIEKQTMAEAEAKDRAMAEAKAKDRAMAEAEVEAAAQAKAMADKKARVAAVSAEDARAKDEAEAIRLAERQAQNCQVKFKQIRDDKSIKFAIGSSNLSTRDTTALDALVTVAKSCPFANIGIEGHTDSTGPAGKNLALSKRRAAAVLDYIAKAGVEKDRLSSTGFGETRPIAPNTTTLGRRTNRRIELIVQ